MQAQTKPKAPRAKKEKPAVISTTAVPQEIIQTPEPQTPAPQPVKKEKKVANENAIILSRKEKADIGKLIPQLIILQQQEIKVEDKIRLIKMEAFDGEQLTLSFKLNDEKIKWAVSLKDRLFGTESKKVGLPEQAYKFFKDLYDTTEPEDEDEEEKKLE